MMEYFNYFQGTTQQLYASFKVYMRHLICAIYSKARAGGKAQGEKHYHSVISGSPLQAD